MLKTLEMKNFTCFPEAKLEFSPGLNVIVGENGTGKSHLLKLGYAVLRSLAGQDKAPAKEVYYRDLAKDLKEIFKAEALGNLCSTGKTQCSVKSSWEDNGNLDFDFSDKAQDLVKLQNLEFAPLTQQPVFIPPKEILSVYYGFQAALEKRELDFDATYLDLARSLSSTSLKGEELQKVFPYFTKLEKEHIKANVLQRGGRFYFDRDPSVASGQKNSPSGKDMEASLMAEGFRKLGVLVYLIKNGSLGEGTSLFWDEPEANLNPKLLTALAAILVKLSSIMQITAATHSLFLMRELDICFRKRSESPKKVLFTGLHTQDNGAISCIQSEKISEIGDIAALDASLEQTDRFMAVRSL